ncbi:cmgc cdk protein kinase [Cystoisospora suis]|uniref:Cmgc cdk protein kinase n=1 Tax=Cystoisospora suis TaxID=483139 RepID=A0A2C6LCU8_9APIC|nr:cmgc cdk protein kinase [Cystoisospora suis]
MQTITTQMAFAAAVETFLDLMAPGEPSADQETRGYQPPETFASFPPLSSFFHKEKDPRTRAQSRQSRDEAPKEMNGELVGVKVPRSSTLPDGGDIQEGTKKIVVEGVSAKTTGEKGRKTEDSDRGRERDKGHEGSIGSKEDRREKMKGEFWRPAAYDVWGAGLTMLKIVLGDLEPLTVQDDRIRSKLERRFADQPAGVRDKALLYQALADLCLIPWIQDHSPSLSTPTHVAASKSFSKKKIDRTSSSEHIFPPLLPSTDLLSLSNTDDRGKGVVPSAVEEGVQSSNRETDSSSMDSTSSHTTVIGKSALSPSISGLTSPLTTATSHEWTFPNTLHSLFSFGMFTSFFLKVASSFCFATEDYLPDFLCRVCKKVLSRSREHVCDQDFASQRERHEGRKEGREEHSQAYGYDWQQRGGAQADLRNFLALVQQSTEDDEKQLQSTLLTKRQAKSLTVSPSSHQREICRVSGLPRTTGSPRSKAGPPSVCRCPSSTEKRDVIKKDGREEGEEAKLFTLVNDGSTVEESPCVRISSSYEDIDNDVEGDLTREKRRVSGFQRKQDAVYLLPDPEESEGKRYEIAISDGCIEDGSTRQVAMDKGVREEAVILRSQSQSLIVAEKQAGREIVETSDFALEEKEAGRRYERSERQRLESRGSLDSRTKGPSESEQGLGKAGEEQDERRRRTNMKIKRQKHNPDACDDKLFARLLRERDKANVGLPNALARDLLRKLLAFDPQERISAEEAVRHPWFAVSPGVAGSQYHELFSQEREKEENDEGEEDEELESRSDRS